MKDSELPKIPSVRKSFDPALTFLLSLACGTLFFILAYPALRGRIYCFDDLGWSHLPFRYFYAHALASGDRFLWAPAFQCGFYLHGDGLVGMLHPLHLVLYSFLPLTAAFNSEFLLNYFFLFFGMTWMLTRFGLPRHSSLFGAMIFTFCGFNLMHYMHINAIAIIAHLPWLIGAADVLIRSKNPRARTAAQAAIALLTGSQCLLGYPQYVLFSSLAEASFVLWKTRENQNKSGMAWWILAKATGGMIGMVQILPTWESMKSSVRQDPSLNFRLSLSLHPINLLQLWSPFCLRGHIYGNNAHEFGLYNGSFSTVALAWPFIRWKKSNEHWKSLLYAASAFAGIMLIFALGRYGLIYPWIARLPLVSLFRIPSRYIVLVHFAMAILAAVAFTELAALSQRGERIPWKSLWPLAVPAALSLLTAAVSTWALKYPSPPDSPPFLLSQTYSSVAWILMGTALLLSAASLTILAARGFRWSLAALIVLTFVDILGWGMNYIHLIPRNIDGIPPHASTMTIGDFLDLIPEPPSATSGRLSFSYQPLWINALTMKGYRLAEGYVALQPMRQLDPHSLLYRRLAETQWIKDLDWQKVSNALPRARMVTRVIAGPAPGANLDHLDITKTTWVDPPVDVKPGKPGLARITLDRPGLIDVAVTNPSRQLLILSESFHPGWHATQDGQPIPVLRAYGDFIACAVDSSSHHIEFRFQPSSFIWGLWLSCAGLCVLACSCVWLLSRKNI